METIKWVQRCETCAGDGLVVDEDGDLWACGNCHGSGEDVRLQRQKDEATWRALRKEREDA